MDENILDSDFKSLETEDEIKERRRKLLPVWIKVFVWIFMVFGILSPLSIILPLFGINFKLSLYGLETFYPLSVVGIVITLLFFSKGVVAFGLWTEKKWAANLAIMDAILGILICALVMIVPLFLDSLGIKVNIRLEILVLIPYLIKMYKIKDEWQKREAK